MWTALALLIAFVGGGLFGVLVMCLLVAGSRADDAATNAGESAAKWQRGRKADDFYDLERFDIDQQ